MGSRLLVLLVLVVLSTLAPVVAAQDGSSPAEPTGDGSTDSEAPSDAKSTAEVLYDQGLADMQAGRFETGCPALAESFRLEPLPGALFTLAECTKGWGRLATARSHYLDYLSRVERMATESRAKQGERPTVARTAVDALNDQVPTLTIVLAEGAPDASVVKRGGAVVPASQIGRPIPLDPGKVVLTLEAPGKAPSTLTVTLEPGERRKVRLAFAKESLPPAPEPDPIRPTPDPEMSPIRLSAYVVGGVGILGVVLGVISGAIAINRNEEIEENCVGLVCNETGISKVETVREAGTTATISLVIGGAGIAAGLVLWFLSEPEDPPLGAFVTADGIGFRW